MSEWKNQDFSQLTVLELRKVAKAMGVQLGAGISKAGIVEKLDRARNAKYSDIPAVPMDFTPIPKSDDKQESPVEKAEVPAAVKDEKPSESPAPANKQPVKNRDLWERLLAAKSKHKVEFIWVKGHAGHELNERCDELATTAADGSNLDIDTGFNESDL